jgi:hypothetical protein
VCRRPRADAHEAARLQALGEFRGEFPDLPTHWMLGTLIRPPSSSHRGNIPRWRIATEQGRVKCIALSKERSSPATRFTLIEPQPWNDNIVCTSTSLSSRNRQTRAEVFRAQLERSTHHARTLGTTNSKARRLLCISETARRMRRTSHFPIPRRAATILICALAVNAIHVM